MFPAHKVLKTDNFTVVEPMIIAKFFCWDATVSNNTPIDNPDLSLLDPQDMGAINSLRHLVSDVNVTGYGTTDICLLGCIIYLKPVPYS